MREFVRSLVGLRDTVTAAPSRRLSIESLEERAVPATADLTTTGAHDSINGALFQQVSPQPTGTGVIHSFVRIQPGGNVAVGQGYNTDARPLQFDENKSPTFTRSLKLSDAPIVITNGIAYREFLLDINQKSSSPLVSLDELRIYTGSAGNLKGYDGTSHTLAGLTAAYDLDAGGVDNTVMLNARLNSGSGSGDMTLLVPDAVLTASGGDYLYLYSKFGATVASNGGFEEWAVKGNGSSLGSISGHILGTDGVGISNVLVTMTWVQDGVTNSASTWSGQGGFYIFSAVPPGSYTVTLTSVPTNYQPADSNAAVLTVLVTSGEIDRDNNFMLVFDVGSGSGSGSGGSSGTGSGDGGGGGIILPPS